VCVCVWVLLSCWYLWSLCRPKEFLPHWVRSFFSFRNICLELNSPSGTSTRDSKRRERRKWVVCVGRRSAREKARDIGYKRKEKRRKEMSSLCCPDSFRIDSRKWIFMQFHKKHKRHVSFNIIHLTFTGSAPSLISSHTFKKKIHAQHQLIHLHSFNFFFLITRKKKS